MALSRKHYVAVARVLNDAWRACPDDACALHAVTVDLARVFKADNGMFDRQRFFDAVTDGTSAGRIIS